MRCRYSIHAILTGADSEGCKDMGTVGRSFREGLDELHAEDLDLRRESERLGPRYAVIEELIKARRHRGITQEQLAEKMGVTQGVVSRWESGKYSPKLETIAAAAQALDYRVDIRFVRERKRSG